MMMTNVTNMMMMNVTNMIWDNTDNNSHLSLQLAKTTRLTGQSITTLHEQIFNMKSFSDNNIIIKLYWLVRLDGLTGQSIATLNDKILH